MVNTDCKHDRSQGHHEQTSVHVRNGVSSLTEGQRATLSVGGTIPLSAVLDRIKRRKWAAHRHSALCSLTGSAVWSSASIFCYSDFPAMMNYTLRLRAKWNTHSRCLSQQLKREPIQHLLLLSLLALMKLLSYSWFPQEQLGLFLWLDLGDGVVCPVL